MPVCCGEKGVPGKVGGQQSGDLPEMACQSEVWSCGC